MHPLEQVDNNQLKPLLGNHFECWSLNVILHGHWRNHNESSAGTLQFSVLPFHSPFLFNSRITSWVAAAVCLQSASASRTEVAAAAVVRQQRFAGICTVKSGLTQFSGSVTASSVMKSSQWDDSQGEWASPLNIIHSSSFILLAAETFKKNEWWMVLFCFPWRSTLAGSVWWQ